MFGVEYSTPCEKHELVSALNNYRSEQQRPTNAAPPTKRPRHRTAALAAVFSTIPPKQLIGFMNNRRRLSNP